MKYTRLIYRSLLLVMFMFTMLAGQPKEGVLTGKIICLDAGHGGTAATDSYRIGPSGEREEWINLRVALLLQKKLEERGAKVLMTRTTDANISFDDRVQLAKENNADIFLSIHHNATADPEVNFPVIYFHGNASENIASVELAKSVAGSVAEHLYLKPTPVSIASDYTIFPDAGTKVLRGTYGIPSVIGEATFFSNPEEESKLKDPEYNEKEALAYTEALEVFFLKESLPIYEEYSLVRVEPFYGVQQGDRMNEIAVQWKSNFIEAYRLYQLGDISSLAEAMRLFTLSASGFPDSWLTLHTHHYRAMVYAKMGEPEKEMMENKRVNEFYVPLYVNKMFWDEIIQKSERAQ